MKKISTLICLLLVVLTGFAQAPRKLAHYLEANSSANSSGRLINSAQTNPATGDTLLWMPKSLVEVNTTDIASFGTHIYDVDGLTPNPSSIQTFSFGVYSAYPGDPFYDSSQGDVDSGRAFLSTSYFTAPATANNWLTFGPITVPSSGATLQWKFAVLDNFFRDGYSVVISKTGFTPADFAAGTVIYSVADNSPSTANDTVLTNSPQININSAAFLNQQVYLGFHHTATDKYILVLDAFLMRAASAPTGIEQFSDNSASLYTEVYPNPSNGIINVSNNIKGAFTVNIYNAVGQSVFTEKYHDISNAVADLSNQPAGVYNVCIKSEKEYITRSVVIGNN